MKKLKLAYKAYINALDGGLSYKEAVDLLVTILGTDEVDVTWDESIPSYIFYEEYVMFLYRGAIFKRV